MLASGLKIRPVNPVYRRNDHTHLKPEPHPTCLAVDAAAAAAAAATSSSLPPSPSRSSARRHRRAGVPGCASPFGVQAPSPPSRSVPKSLRHPVARDTALPASSLQNTSRWQRAPSPPGGWRRCPRAPGRVRRLRRARRIVDHSAALGYRVWLRLESSNLSCCDLFVYSNQIPLHLADPGQLIPSIWLLSQSNHLILH
jgi:hypothetical protein